MRRKRAGSRVFVGLVWLLPLGVIVLVSHGQDLTSHRGDARQVTATIGAPLPIVDGLPPQQTNARIAATGSGDLQEEVQSEPLELRLQHKPNATVEDAWRLFLAMAIAHDRVSQDVEPEASSLEEVIRHLGMLNLTDPRKSGQPSNCLRRDDLAYMAACYMGCRPGLLTGLFGMTRRYAHREMLHQRLITPGPPAAQVSGSELLSVVTRISKRVQPDDGVRLEENEIH